MGKLREEKDLTFRSGNKSKENLARSEDQSNIRSAFVRAQSTDLERRIFGALNQVVAQDIERAKEAQKRMLLPIQVEKLVKDLVRTPLRNWTPNQMAEAEKLLPKEVVDQIIAHQEKSKPQS